MKNRKLSSIIKFTTTLSKEHIYMKRAIIFYLLILVGIVLHAQSAFSFYGPPDIAFQRDAFGEGMGGTGAGDLFRVNTSLINPALSVTTGRTYFSSAISMGNVNYRDSEGNSFGDSQFYLPYFNVIFPHKQNRFGFHYQHISSGNLNSEARFGSDADIFAGSEISKVEFSMYKAGVFWANRNRRLHFGTGVSYLFGHHVMYAGQDFDDPEMTSSAFEVEKTFRNPTFTIGVAKSHDNVSWGLAGNYPLELKGDTTFRANAPFSQTETGAVYEYPASVNFGLTYRLSELFRLSTDFDYEFWERTENFANPVNTTRCGVGIAWDAIPHSKKFLAVFPVRAGLSYRNLPFKVENNLVHEWAYHFGVSLPLKQYDSYIDVATKFFNRGDANKTNYEENGFLLTFGIHGFDFLRKPPNRKTPRDIPRTFEDRARDSDRPRREEVSE
jgi:hypothetical protein